MNGKKYTDTDGHTYELDSDGDRLWDLPESWSLDKDPAGMGPKELAAASARLLGCKPEWSRYYRDWVCSCRNGTHACDSQCSVIADYPRDVRHVRRIALYMERLGMEVPKATAEPADICRAALRGVTT